MQKTLEELGKEYLESAKTIEALIKKYRGILREAYSSGNYLKTYDQKRELEAIGNKLINYYNKEDNSDELH